MQKETALEKGTLQEKIISRSFTIFGGLFFGGRPV